MKNNVKNYVILACLSASFVAGTAAVTSAAVNAKAEETLVSAELKMNKGASLYLEEVSGLKFSYTVTDYTEETHGDNNYGMLIVPYDYLAKAGITDLTLATNDYVPTLQAAVGDTITNAPIVVDGLQPTKDGLVEYSIGELYENNYARAFFGIGFEATETADGTAYEYAVQNDNVRSVFEVANLALNAHVYDEGDLDGSGDLDEEEENEFSKIADNKETLNAYVTTGFKFVYGDATPTATLEATYVGGEITPAIALTPLEGKENIKLDLHWNYSAVEGDQLVELTAEGKLKGVARGQGKVNAGLAGLVEVPAAVTVLKDAAEFQIYNDSTSSYLFREVNAPVVDGTYTAQIKGGYWTRERATDGYLDPGYLVIKNPDSADGKYKLNADGISMDFYFKGNNMPTVEFFGTTIENLSLGKGGDTNNTKNAPTGYVVFNGAARGDTYTKWDTLQNAGMDSTNFVTFTNGTATSVLEGMSTHSNYRWGGIVTWPTFFMYGMSDYGTSKNPFTRAKYNSTSTDSGSCFLRHFDQGTKTSFLYNSTSTVTNWKLSAVSNFSKFSMYSLMKEGEQQYWHYQVGIALNEDNEPALSATLYKTDAQGNHVETFATYKARDNSGNMTEVSSERSGYVVVYGALKGNSSSTGDRYNTQIAYKLPY